MTGEDAGETIDGLHVYTLHEIGYGSGEGFKGWNCHHDNFKDSNPNVEWKATLEQAEKIGMGTRQYTLKKI